MPEQGRILKFPERQQSGERSYARAVAVAQEYLSLDTEQRTARGIQIAYSNPDELMALCSQLREILNAQPSVVAEEATRMYSWLSECSVRVGYFDERDFFLGESALLAGSAARILGDRSECDLWLDRAEAGYRHTINPAPSLARIAYARLTLRYDTHRHREVLELLPSVALTFEKLGMHSEFAKCLFLEAQSLKALGRSAEAASRLERVAYGAPFEADRAIRGMALLNLGDLQTEDSRFEEALTSYRAAQPLIEASNQPAALADLQMVVGETLRKMGQFVAAVAAFRESIRGFVALGMKTQAAYLRVALAQALLENANPREAEWEILAALPTINEQQMVPEGFAAVAILQESVKARKTDIGALSELRAYLQANN